LTNGVIAMACVTQLRASPFNRRVMECHGQDFAARRGDCVRLPLDAPFTEALARVARPRAAAVP